MLVEVWELFIPVWRTMSSNKVTGQCPHGCDVGYHGNRCDQGMNGVAYQD